MQKKDSSQALNGQNEGGSHQKRTVPVFILIPDCCILKTCESVLQVHEWRQEVFSLAKHTA